MLQGAMLVWFILTGLSVIFVVWDSITNGVTSWVQRLAWILASVYTGPVGAFLYVLACRRPFPGGHDHYTAATWKQGLNSEMHCLAGDATGIVVAQVRGWAGCRPRPRGHGHAGVIARRSAGMDHRYLRGAARGGLGDGPVGTFALRRSLVE